MIIVDFTEDSAYPGQFRYLSAPVTGLTYNYTYDSLGRPVDMSSPAHSRTGNQPVTWVDNVTYGVANELLTMRYRLDAANGQTTANYYNESRQYNTRLQLTQLSVTPTGGASTPLNVTYQFKSGQNDGLIEKPIDNLAGETDYLYDNWKRLISATQTAANGWGLSFSYDGFGNRLSQTVTQGSGPNVTVGVNPATNRISDAGYSYDANGNLTNAPWATYGYDIDNRLVSVSSSDTMKYDHENRRYYRKKSGSNYEELFRYGAYGELLMKLHPLNSNWSRFVSLGKGVYFAGRMIKSPDGEPVQDQVGSVTYNRFGDQTTATSRYFPYGEKVSGSGGIGAVQFGTYRRDLQNDSTLDYADQSASTRTSSAAS